MNVFKNTRTRLRADGDPKKQHGENICVYMALAFCFTDVIVKFFITGQERWSDWAWNWWFQGKRLPLQTVHNSLFYTCWQTACLWFLKPSKCDVQQVDDEHHFRKPANDITSQLEINFGDLGRPGRGGRGGPRGGRGGRGRGERGERGERGDRGERGEPTRPTRGGRTDRVCWHEAKLLLSAILWISILNFFFCWVFLAVIYVCAKRGWPRGLPSPGLSSGC